MCRTLQSRIQEIDKMQTKLIVLRGQSGSGKSTVAKKLQKISQKPLFIVEQDYYKNELISPIIDIDSSTRKSLQMKLIICNALELLDQGYDCIVEGNFSNSAYQNMFDELFKQHPSGNFMYYYNISFEESLRRHNTRDKKHEFGSDEMRQWYFENPPYGHSFEKSIPEEYSLDQTIDMILKDTKMVIR